MLKETTDCIKDFGNYNLENIGSAAAAPREASKPSLSKYSADHSTVFKTDKGKQSYWYHTGVRAKQRDYGDMSPFYENATADYFFKCGYDDVSFVEAQQVLKDKIQQIMESNPLLTEVTNEYASKQIQK